MRRVVKDKQPKIGCVSIRLRNNTQHSKDVHSHHVDNIVWSIKIYKML
jgi:hypothetical protein